MDPEKSVLSPKAKSHASDVHEFKPQQPKEFIWFPIINKDENPVRNLRVGKELFEKFQLVKAAIVQEVARDNAAITRAEYKWCMECWLQDMYCNNDGAQLPPIDEYRQFIMVANADRLLFAQNVDLCTNCDQAKPIGLGEQLMWNCGFKQ